MCAEDGAVVMGVRGREIGRKEGRKGGMSVCGVT